MINGVKCGPDGLRCDVYGNLWASSNAGRNVGYSGATCWSPDGKLLGRIRTPEVVGNITFGGPKRNRLFMAASQSLYAFYTNTQGAGPSYRSELGRAPWSRRAALGSGTISHHEHVARVPRSGLRRHDPGAAVRRVAALAVRADARRQRGAPADAARRPA